MKRLLAIGTLCLLGIVALSSCFFNKLSSEKQIKSFVITTPYAQGVINETLKTITVDVPEGTDVTSLVPSIVVSDDAIVEPGSGVAQNFTNAVSYVVTAEDGTKATYVVTVTVGGVGPGPGGDPTHIDENISANTTWKDLGLPVDYVVDGWIHIEGNALLTIEPGVTIMFTGNNGGMTVEENAGLRMVGTADKPIQFVGPTNNPNNGSWNRVQIDSKRNDNVWEYVEFLRGGSSDYMWDAVVDLNDAWVSMKHCTIDGSLGCGLDMDYGCKFLAFENNVIKNCASYPMALDDASNLFSLNGNNTFTSNGKNYVYVNDRDLDINDHVTLVKMPVPYFLNEGLYMGNPYKVTIEAGTEFVFASGKDFSVDVDATLIASGTADAPIVFRGMENEVGYWKGIRYHSTKEASVMRYCTVSNCGEDDPGFYSACLSIWDNARLTMTNCTFGNCRHYGIALDGIEVLTNIAHGNITFASCASGNVFVETGGTYKGVEYTDGQVLDALP